jgi:superoxide dismutase, Fe-Mn family
MSETSRREMLSGIGAIAAASGLIGLKGSIVQAAEIGGEMKEYTLPPLPYAYDALEPYIDKETMMLHHDKHHAGYVKGLNTAIAELAAVDKGGSAADMAKVRALTDSLAFNGSGHALHSIFWDNMKKDGGGEPKGELATHIDKCFGSFNAFQAHFSAAATQVQGSGWGILSWDPLGQRLLVLEAEKHQNWTFQHTAPLLVLDVWEHAYYLKYQNKRPDYVKAFWHVINWEDVAERLSMAKKTL